tara:strand:+ start:73 stop:801 length:729 start_codon:yes stop_codon:yes gene_type:complete
MKLNTNNYKYKELLKWYRKAVNQPAKKVVIDHISEIKKIIPGKHVLFIGLSEFRKKFESSKYVSFIAIDEFVSSDNITEAKKLPFEDNSHDVIIIIHALDYTENPYELVREIDRIGTDDVKISIVGFNKFSLWGAMKPMMNKTATPWLLNFHSLYSVKEWFKLLGYQSLYKDTSFFLPIISKNITKYLSKMVLLQKFIGSNLGGIYFLVFNKNVIPLTPVKLKFKGKYLVTTFPKSSMNKIR